MDRLVLIYLMTRLLCVVYTTRASPVRELHQDCGLIYNGPSGSFQSAGYPDNYRNNLYCSQTFEVEDGKAVELTFENFYVESNGYSCNDKVLIYDGPDSQSPLLRRLCGEDIPPPVRSTGRNLSIYLDTDMFNSRRGYNGTYRAVDVGQTTQRYFGPKAFFSSPGYVWEYRNNERCGHTIEVGVGQRIEFTFRNFKIQDNCTSDNLTIYDGPSNQSTPLGTYCGENLPGLVRSTGRHLYLYFQTDDRDTLRGYLGTFRAFSDDQNTAWHMAVRTEINTQDFFVYQFFGSPGWFENDNYSNLMTYGQLLEVREGQLVELSFRGFQVEDHNNCSFDNVTIYDGPNRNSTRLGTYCGSTLPDKVISSGRQLYVYMQTNSSVTGRGFQGFYKSVSNVCGSFHRGSYGTFSSPDSPEDYPNSNACGQTFYVGRDQVVELTFEDFEVNGLFGTFRVPSIRPNTPVSASGLINCTLDKVTIYDGPDRSSDILGTYCGDTSPGPVRSTGRQIYLYFQGGGSFSGTYRAKFNFSCGTTVEQSNIIRVGGVRITPNIQDHPWNVYIAVRMYDCDNTFSETLCSGAIIARNWVITSGGCAEISTNMTVYAGSTYKKGHRSQIFPVKRRILHPAYNTSFFNDISLLEIDGEFNITSALTRPVCLAEANDSITFDDQSCVFTAYDDNYGNLQETAATVYNRSYCEEKTSVFNDHPFLKENLICASLHPDGGIAASSVSGAPPLVCARPGGGKVLAGVYVGGSGDIRAMGRPGGVAVFMRVSYYRQWIDETLATS